MTLATGDLVYNANGEPDANPVVLANTAANDAAWELSSNAFMPTDTTFSLQALRYTGTVTATTIYCEIEIQANTYMRQGGAVVDASGNGYGFVIISSAIYLYRMVAWVLDTEIATSAPITLVAGDRFRLTVDTTTGTSNVTVTQEGTNRQTASDATYTVSLAPALLGMREPGTYYGMTSWGLGIGAGVSRSADSIDSFQRGDTNSTISCTGLDASPTTQIVTVTDGTIADTCSINTWSATSIDVDIDVALPPGTYDIEVTDDTGTVTLADQVLVIETGRELLTFNGITPPLSQDSIAKGTTADHGITPVAGDMWGMESNANVTYLPNSNVEMVVAQTHVLAYWFFDASTATMYTGTATLAEEATLTNQTLTSTGQNTQQVQVDTNVDTSDIHAYWSTSVTPPSATDLEAGTGAAYKTSQAITTTGTKTINGAGLVAATTYYCHLLHNNSGVRSAIVTTAGVATDAPVPNQAPTISGSRSDFALTIDDLTSTTDYVNGYYYWQNGTPDGGRYQINLDNGGAVPVESAVHSVPGGDGQSVLFNVPAGYGTGTINRSEILVAHSIQFGETTTTRFSIYIPAGFTYSSAWQLIHQYLQMDAGSPIVAFYLLPSGQLKIGIRNDANLGTSLEMYLSASSIEEGQFIEFISIVKPSRTSDGYLKVFKRLESEIDFTTLVDETGLNIGKSNLADGVTPDTDPVYAAKIGLYRGAEDIDQSVWFDQITCDDVIELGSINAIDTNCQPSRTNSVLYSNDYASAEWIKSALASVTLDADVSFDGLPMSLIVENSSTAIHRVYQLDAVSAGECTVSVRAKSAGRNYIRFFVYSAAAGYVAESVFNITTGAIQSTVHGTAEITDLGDGEYQLTLRGTASATCNVYVQLLSDALTSSYLGDGVSGAYICQCQRDDGVDVSAPILTADVPVTRPRADFYTVQYSDVDPVTLSVLSGNTNVGIDQVSGGLYFINTPVAGESYSALVRATDGDLTSSAVVTVNVYQAATGAISSKITLGIGIGGF